jgi:hypothetical protein
MYGKKMAATGELVMGMEEVNQTELETVDGGILIPVILGLAFGVGASVGFQLTYTGKLGPAIHGRQ